MGAGNSKVDKTAVVIGSGYSGVAMVRELQKVFKTVILISPTGTLFHKIGAIRNPAVEGWEKTSDVPLTKLAASLGEGNFSKDTATEIQDNKVLLASGKEVPFDYCVIAIGSTNAFANMAWDLSVEDRRAAWTKLREEVKAAKNVLIVGGGTVGCELAGEIRAADKEKKITVVHNGATLINHGGSTFYPAKFTDALQAKFKALGITTKLGFRANLDGIIDGANMNAVYSSGQREVTIVGSDGTKETIETDLIISTIGNTINNIKGVPSAKDGVSVDEYFRVTGRSNVFAIGDAADCKDAVKTVMNTADHVRQAFKTILSLEAKRKMPRPYVPNKKVMCLVPCGPNDGVGVMGNSLLPSFVNSMKCKDLFTNKVWGEQGEKAVLPPLKK